MGQCLVGAAGPVAMMISTPPPILPFPDDAATAGVVVTGQ